MGNMSTTTTITINITYIYIIHILYVNKIKINQDTLMKYLSCNKFIRCHIFVNDDWTIWDQ